VPTSTSDPAVAAPTRRRGATLPDFLGIGAQKAGTTWLYRNLRSHPGIWLPSEKELHFFDSKRGRRHALRAKLFGEAPDDERWRRQVQRQRRADRSERSLRWELRYFLGRPDDAWYARLFAPAGDRVTGEITPDYSTLDADQVAHVHALLPDARIIFMLRNPIERAWSHAVMGIIRAQGQSEEEASEEFLRHFDGERSRVFGDYVRTIDTWSAFYPPERFFIGFLEDVHFHPKRLLLRIYDFLGAGPADSYPSLKRKVHSGDIEAMPVSMAAHLAVLQRDLLAELDRRFSGYAAWWRYCAWRLADPNVGRERVTYPFHESVLWSDWIASRDGAALDLQSGTLAEISRP